MSGAQTQAYHSLVQAFSAAADPSELGTYKGTPETNLFLARLTRFVEALNGPEQAVLVNMTQLQGLANAARGAMEYAHEGKGVPREAINFFNAYDEERENVRYSNGLINTLT